MPFSETNWHWLAPINPGRDHLTKQDRATYAREHNLRRRFGITVADYDRMLAEQNGACAICFRPPSQIHAKSGKVRDLAVDHDHETGEVRGLLCTDCNTAIGLFSDDPALIRTAADYLRRHRTERVISDMTIVATLPAELGAITGLRVENGSVIASSESGVDYIIPPNKLPRGTGEAA